MVSRGVAEIIATMEREERRLRDQHAQALRTAHHLESEMMRLREAYAALSGGPAPQPSPPPEADTSPSSGWVPRRAHTERRGISRSELGYYIERILAEGHRLTEPKLLERLRQMVEADGKPSQGIERRLERALREGPFRFNGAHWVLDDTV